MKNTKIKLVRLAMVTMISTAWSAPTYAASKPASSRAMVALSAKAANRKAKQDLLSILQPSSKFSKGNRVAVSGIGMDTVPHGTGMAGLCTMDQLILWYAATAAKPEPMDEPRRPIGLGLTHLYHAARTVDYLDDRYPTDKATAIGNTWSRDCEKLQSDKTATWFKADSATVAVDAVNALHATMDALRSGKVDAKGCDYPLRQGETCSQAILRVGRADKIGTIGHDCQAAAGQSCF